MWTLSEKVLVADVPTLLLNSAHGQELSIAMSTYHTPANNKLSVNMEIKQEPRALLEKESFLLQRSSTSNTE